jgi:excisionase family DNA binding protein
LDQVARRWNRSRKQIRHLLATQQLRFVLIGHHLRIPHDEVRRYEGQGG